MITAWDVYMITRLDVLNTITTVLFIAFGIVVALWLLMYPIITDLAFGDDNKKSGNCLKKTIIVWLLLAIPTIIVPSTKEACAIYLLPKIVNNEQIQKIPNNFANLLNAKIEEWIKETISDEKKTTKESN